MKRNLKKKPTFIHRTNAHSSFFLVCLCSSDPRQKEVMYETLVCLMMHQFFFCRSVLSLLLSFIVSNSFCLYWIWLRKIWNVLTYSTGGEEGLRQAARIALRTAVEQTLFRFWRIIWCLAVSQCLKKNDTYWALRRKESVAVQSQLKRPVPYFLEREADDPKKRIKACRRAHPFPQQIALAYKIWKELCLRERNQRGVIYSFPVFFSFISFSPAYQRKKNRNEKVQAMHCEIDRWAEGTKGKRLSPVR